MKSKVTRSMRRKVSNAIHAYYASPGKSFGRAGFCPALSIMQERIYKNSGDPALSKAMQVLRDEIMYAVEGPYAYIPYAMLFDTREAGKDANLSDAYKERIRRTWLRHWTEVGVILNHDRWQALQRNRADARAVRKTHKAFAKDNAALATESSVSNA